MAESLDKNTKIAQIGQRHILYDAALIEHPDEDLFLPKSSAQTDGVAKTAKGRGEAVFFERDGIDLVLKHYHRGGMAEKWLGDRYLGFNPEKTRSFREWRLLKHLRAEELPAPVPVAACIIKNGLFYRADLITREIKHASTLADLLLQGELDQKTWLAVGHCIRQFHDRDVYHDDLNARNILIDKTGIVYLIDFDKGYVRYMSSAWKAANLARLNRSLLKFKSKNRDFYFNSGDWKALLSGYGSM